MHAIPKIIAFLSDSVLDVRMAGLDALVILSEQRKVIKLFYMNFVDVL
jgi:hypothetical protein